MEEKTDASFDKSLSKSSPSWEPKTRFGSFLSSYFGIQKAHSSPVNEILGGLVTFLAMFYILPVNANMLTYDWANLANVQEIVLYSDIKIPLAAAYAAVFAATAISSGLATVLMGLYGKLPIGLASSMGINSLIAFNVMLNLGYNFAQSMCLVFLDGVLFLIISLTPLRNIIVNSIPKSLKIAISAGIGFFLAFIGFQDTKIVVASSATCVTFGDFKSPYVLVALLGIFLVFALSCLPKKNKVCFWISKFAVIISLAVIALLSGILGSCGVEGMPQFYNSSYSLSSLGHFKDIFGICFHGFDVLAKPGAYPLIFALLFIDFFDTAGTLVAVETTAGMIDENGVPTVSDRQAMITDAIGTCFGAICGTTTVSSFAESATGIEAGGKTGLSAVTTGLLFFLAILIYPALSVFSCSAVTGLALVYVGACMFINLVKLDWKDWVAVGSAFLTIIIMLVSYSISNGIAWGFISYTIMNLASGRFHKKDLPLLFLSIAFIILYIVEFSTGIK